MVPVVESTFRILEELARTGPIGLNEVTQRTALAKSTVFRVLSTLNELGYVVRSETRTYSIGYAMADLAGDNLQTEAIRRASLPHMLELRNRFGETVNLGQLQLDKVVYVEVVPSEYALRLHERHGATVPLHASALGKAILAFSDEAFAADILSGDLLALTPNTITDAEQVLRELKRIRDRGYALDKGEISSLATCVAAPILNEQRRAIAAISISGPASRFNPVKNSDVVDNLMKVADQISRQIQNRRAGAKKS